MFYPRTSRINLKSKGENFISEDGETWEDVGGMNDDSEDDDGAIIVCLRAFTYVNDNKTVSSSGDGCNLGISSAFIILLAGFVAVKKKSPVRI